MNICLSLKQFSGCLQIFDDFRVSILNIFSGIFTGCFDKKSIGGGGLKYRQAIFLTDLIIIGAVTGSDMDNTGTILKCHKIGIDDIKSLIRFILESVKNRNIFSVNKF